VPPPLSFPCFSHTFFRPRGLPALAGRGIGRKYHLVWCPKYRKRILVNALAKRLRELLYQKVKEIKAAIQALQIMPDHVHMLVESDPTVQGIHQPPAAGRVFLAQVVSAESVVSQLLHRQHRCRLQSDSQALHRESKDPAVTTISCVGGGRTPRLRKNKVVPCAGYLCGVGYCKQNPKFALAMPVTSPFTLSFRGACFQFSQPGSVNGIPRCDGARSLR
jgi:REP element-mobilizing transposase RayT